MNLSPQSPNDIRDVDSAADAARCFPLMRQLRPHLTSEQDFVARWGSQTAAGYKLVALWREGAPTALAGFRLQENLVYGLHFYVDDLITEENVRSVGYGRLMLDYLKSEAYRLGCGRLVLDTPLTNALGHRFYFRQGLLARALRFSIDLSESSLPGLAPQF